MNKKKKVITVSDFEKATGIRLTTNHSGKMAGMISLSTSVVQNPFCAARRRCSGSVCQKCYAAALCGCRKPLEKKLARNTELLNARIYGVDEMPILNCRLFRFEAFGDLNSVVQVVNYFNLCRKNPAVKFALWTKNPAFVAAAIKGGHKKPKNLVIILSSMWLNTTENPTKWGFVDKVFTVYDKEHAAAVEINCGARNCLTCGRCYKKTRGIEFVNELLK